MNCDEFENWGEGVGMQLHFIIYRTNYNDINIFIAFNAICCFAC